MEMRIRITREQADGPLAAEVFELSLSLSGLAPVAATGGGLTASGCCEAEADGRAAWAQACDEAEAAETPDCEDEAQAGTAELAAATEPGLFEKLAALRKKIAAETGVPPYVVFHDDTLHAMCRALPADLEALKSIQGVGKAKLDKYGDAFVAVIREHTVAA